MADNFDIKSFLNATRVKIRSSDVGGVQTLHAIVDAIPAVTNALLAVIEANTGITAGAVTAAKMQTDVKTITLPTAIVNTQKKVAVPGTAEPLAAVSTPLASVAIIKALTDNTDFVYVGGVGVDATNGIELAAGESVPLSVDDLDKVYLDAAIADEGVSVLAS